MEGVCEVVGEGVGGGRRVFVRKGGPGAGWRVSFFGQGRCCRIFFLFSFGFVWVCLGLSGCSGGFGGGR